MIVLEINRYMRDDMRPEMRGDANQEATMRKIIVHLIELQPRNTIEKPIVAPMILWVPEMGILR